MSDLTGSGGLRSVIEVAVDLGCRQLTAGRGGQLTLILGGEVGPCAQPFDSRAKNALRACPVRCWWLQIRCELQVTGLLLVAIAGY
jgi:hypothetical protein